MDKDVEVSFSGFSSNKMFYQSYNDLLKEIQTLKTKADQDLSKVETGLNSIDNKVAEFNNALTQPFQSYPTYVASGTDLNNFNKNGFHIVTTASNKPPQVGTQSVMLNVEIFKSSDGAVRWGIQRAYDLNNPSKLYVRKVDFQQSSNNTAWFAVDFKRLAGKKIICMGDSITYGNGSSSRSTKSYPPLLSALTGATVQNNGLSGASWQKDGVPANDDISVVHQSSIIDFTGADYVTIFAGTNDWGRSALPIGNNSDTVENTLKGSINVVIGRIQAANPTCKIALITPMWRQRRMTGDNRESDTNDYNGKFLIEYVNAIVEMAEKYHLPVLNIYKNAGIYLNNHTTFLSDGLHPNDAGHELLANKIAGFLDSVY